MQGIFSQPLIRTLVGAAGKDEPASLTVTVRPATLREPVRDAELALAATVYLVLPLPDPLAPDAMVIQLALLVAVQPQPEPPVTVTVAVPPPAVTLCDVGETCRLHDPLSVIVTVLPAIVIVPVLDAVVPFAVTR
jgi:hypothetical protein